MAECRELPLFAHADERHDALSATRLRRRRFARHGMAIGFACAAELVTIALPPLPRLVWNASASAPVGLYTVAPDSAIAVGDMVIARTPAGIRAMAARRQYIPANVPLVKRVAAAQGDRVCAVGALIIINGRAVAVRRKTDTRGRSLSQWHGCISLGADAVFLMMADAPDSFDGRYFGATSRADIVGKATALWVR